MKLYWLLLSFISCHVIAQFPTGGGNFPEYKLAEIESLTKMYVKCSDSTKNDTLFRYRQEFDENGNMIEEHFNCIYDSDCYYRYYYNDEGFLMAVDTNGFFGYGRSYGGSDTTYQTEIREYRTTIHGQQVVKEVRIDHLRKDKYITYYDYNKDGKSIRETTYFADGELTRVLIYVTRYNSDGFVESESYYGGTTAEIMTEDNLVSKFLYLYEKRLE